MLNYNILVNIGGIKGMNNYVPLHVHTELSLLDSCTNFKDYVKFCVDNSIKAICFTEHGNIFQHFAKRQYCKENGIQLIRIPYTKYSTLCLNDLIEGGLNDK